MKIRQASVISIILLLILTVSCTTWSKKEWDELIDRTFYFQKFKYSYKGSSREHAYYFMKEFPLKEMIAMLEKKYNIKINTDDFNKFLLDGNYQKEVKSITGTFLDNDFTWEAKTPQRYEIFFEYETTFDDGGSKVKERNFELEMYTNKKLRKRFFANVWDKKNVIEKLEFHLQRDK